MNAITGLLDQVGAAAQGSAVQWCVSYLLPGFSETTEYQRILVTLVAPEPGNAIITSMLAILEELRNTSQPATEVPAGTLRYIAKLADTVRQGPIIEMWACKIGGVAAFITHNTSLNVNELLSRMQPS